MDEKKPLSKTLLTNDQYIKRHEPLIEAWQAAGFIDNAVWEAKDKLETDYDKAVMAVMLDNTRRISLPNVSFLDPARDNVTVSEAAKKNVAKTVAIMEQAENQIPQFQLNETQVTTTSMSGATNLPMVLGYVRKIMPRMFMKNIVSIQPLALPTGRVFVLDRVRHASNTDAGSTENRAGWSFRSWDDTPGEATTVAKTMRFTLTSEDVTAADHKIATEVGVEIEQDLMAYHGLDAAGLVNSAAADEMAMELDERMLYRMWVQAGGGTFKIGTKPTAFSQSEWDRRYLEVIERANENIFTNQRVDPRILIVGSDWKVALSNINNTFVPSPANPAFNQGQGQDSFIDGGARVLGDYLVYRAPKPFPTTDALLVYKGNSWVDASMFWLPYVPVQIYSVWRDPYKQVQTVSWISRYALYYVGTNFRGDKRVGLLQIDNTVTGTSYPAYTEYV